jgi:hypothetical protein
VCQRSVLVGFPKHRRGSNSSDKWQGHNTSRLQHMGTRYYELRAFRGRVRGCREVQAVCCCSRRRHKVVPVRTGVDAGASTHSCTTFAPSTPLSSLPLAHSNPPKHKEPKPAPGRCASPGFLRYPSRCCQSLDASDMYLRLTNNASYLSESKAKSRSQTTLFSATYQKTRPLHPISTPHRSPKTVLSTSIPPS